MDTAAICDEALPQTLPVLVEIRVPAGSESMYYHCTATDAVARAL